MAELQQVKLSQLHESPFNPRQKFDALDELAESIRINGVIQPLIARKVDGKNGHDAGLEIIAGARRFRAAKLAKLESVPVLVRDLNDAAARTEQILENLQREDIAPLEEAAAYQELLKATEGKLVDILGDEKAPSNMSPVEGLAKRIGKSKRYVYARLELLKLAAPVQAALAKGKIEASHAQELVPLKPDQQKAMLAEIDSARRYDGRPMPVEEIRDVIASRFSEKPKPPQLSAKEKARRAREAAAAKKRQAAYDAQAKRSEAERVLSHQVTARAVAALWPKMKAANAKARDWFLDVILADAVRGGSMGAALRVAKGQPMKDKWEAMPMPEFVKRPRAERIAIVLLGKVLDRSDWHPKDVEPIYRWAKIDRGAMAKQIQAEQKAAAAKVHALHLAKTQVQTSAKRAGKAKAKRAA